MSIARRTFPSRLELKRRAGSFRDAPLAKVNFTMDLYVSPVQMIPSCDHVGVPGFVGFTHFNSSTTSGSASLMSVRTLLRVFPRQSLSSAILFEMSCDGDWFDITYLVQSHSRRPSEGNELADAAVPQVQAAPGEHSYDQRNRRARRVCDPQMRGHRAAEIAGHHDCGEDRRLRDEVEHHQGAFRNDNGDDGRFGIAIARDNFGHRVGAVGTLNQALLSSCATTRKERSQPVRCIQRGTEMVRTVAIDVGYLRLWVALQRFGAAARWAF